MKSANAARCIVALAAATSMTLLPATLALASIADAPFASESRCFPETFKRRIERGLAGYADVADIPGISVGITTADALVHAASVGHANRSEDRAASPETLYNIASVTKVFTATLALVLADEGVIALDAPVGTYLPDTIRVPVDAAGGAITVRHLLSHTSGLPRDPPNRRNQDTQGPIDPNIWDAYDIKDLYAALPATKLNGNVGERFEYSNYGYALLGHVLERAGGASYERLLRSRILAPLGMTDTAITLERSQARRLAAFYWSEDPDRREQSLRARYGEVSAFIGLTSSLQDMARFVAAHLRNAGDPSPIPASVRTAMATPRAAAYTDPMFRTEIGLGWFRETRLDDGSVIVFHTGEVDGHTAGVFIDPAHGVGVVVLQNLGGDTGAQGVEQIGHWLLGLAPEAMRDRTDCSGGSAAGEKRPSLKD